MMKSNDYGTLQLMVKTTLMRERLWRKHNHAREIVEKSRVGFCLYSHPILRSNPGTIIIYNLYVYKYYFLSL